MTLSIAMSNWTPEDISWDRFDPSLVDKDIVKLVKAASMVEYNARDYATYLRTVFGGDPALGRFVAASGYRFLQGRAKSLAKENA